MQFAPHSYTTRVTLTQHWSRSNGGLTTRPRPLGAGAHSPATAEALAPGAVLEGAYRSLCAIGRGGMGVGYQAIDLDRQCHVTVKVPHREHPSLTAIRRAMETEAVALRRVRH